MKDMGHLAVITATLAVTTLISGCETKFARNFEKQVALTKDGIVGTKTNIEEGFSNACLEAPPVSQNADEVLRLVSSEEQTVFTVDGKEMGKAKQLKVCIDSSAEHTVVAEPPGCEAKIEKLKPPYDFPIYEFRFLMAECKAAESQPVAVPETRDIPTKKSKSKAKAK